jgi:hypothetical protein
LKVQYDSDEEQPKPKIVAQPQTTLGTSPQLFNVQPAEQKKKKVRPEKKEDVIQHKVAEDNEGFEVVGKKVHNKPRLIPIDENPSNDFKKEKHIKNKGAYDPRNKPVVAGKREFERHSGTGRGKEISKQGAGGKHTWGTNTNTVAKREEEEFNQDDYYIHYALNPRPKRKQEDAPTEAKEGEVVEQKVEEWPQTEAKPETKEWTGEWRKKGKKGEEEKKEIPEAERLIVPENALSYEEYLAKRNQNRPTQAPKVVERPKETNDLNVQVKVEVGTLGTTATTAKKQVKPKVVEQKVDPKHVEAEKTFFENLKIEGGEGYQKRDYRGENQGGQIAKSKFRFSNDDFPQL